MDELGGNAGHWLEVLGGLDTHSTRCVIGSINLSQREPFYPNQSASDDCQLIKGDDETITINSTSLTDSPRMA